MSLSRFNVVNFYSRAPPPSLRLGIPVPLTGAVEECEIKQDGWMMEGVKDGTSEGERAGLGWVVWVSLAGGGAPPCWIHGTGRDHWHLGVKG